MNSCFWTNNLYLFKHISLYILYLFLVYVSFVHLYLMFVSSASIYHLILIPSVTFCLVSNTAWHYICYSIPFSC